MNTNGILKVDSHEKGYVLKSLRDVGMNYEVGPLNQMGLGDLFWDTDFGAYSVEHKTVGSLVRTYWNRPSTQLSRQFQDGVNNVLIIEGVVVPSGQGPARNAISIGGRATKRCSTARAMD